MIQVNWWETVEELDKHFDSYNFSLTGGVNKRHPQGANPGADTTLFRNSPIPAIASHVRECISGALGAVHRPVRNRRSDVDATQVVRAQITRYPVCVSARSDHAVAQGS